MAIEDGVCLARLLPLETPADAIYKRLQMFEDIRYKHVEYVRDETRHNGRDESDRPSSLLSLSNTGASSLLTGFPDMYPMMQYCYEHDEWKHTDEYLKASLTTSGGGTVDQSSSGVH
jgi:2-polyprenyl-6-methoxyphenol hydroxylase-like FAD-dependent oxidoreductase